MFLENFFYKIDSFLKIFANPKKWNSKPLRLFYVIIFPVSIPIHAFMILMFIGILAVVGISSIFVDWISDIIEGDAN